MSERYRLFSLKSAIVIGVVLCSLGAADRLAAQPVLNFKRIISNWPTVELYFTVGCNGTPAYFTDKKYFKVVENGVEIGEFELWCPDPTMRCAMSTALVFDASGSMMGSGNAGAKAAGNAYVDLLDGTADEATVIWFNTTVTVYQSMTTAKDLLHNAINALPASGATAVWDGIYIGVMELVHNGVNQCRSVIAMTDGGDNSSMHYPSEIISLANRNRIRVFTVGLGSGINSAELQTIATLTGGRYYETPNASQLSAIYQEIVTIILQGFQECMITYQARCKDGTVRTVDLSLLNFCGGGDAKTKTFAAPRDTSSFTSLRMRLGSAIASGNKLVTVPLEVLDPLNNEVFNTSTFTVVFDTSRAKFQGISAPAGTALEGVPFTIAPSPTGVTFSTVNKKALHVSQVPAPLAYLSFLTSDPPGKDSVLCPLQLQSWAFSAGCFRPVLTNGSITITPRRPSMTCNTSAPLSIYWNRKIRDYNWNPFDFTAYTENAGDREAINARFRIIYNSSDFTLVNPISTTQNGSPSTVNPNQTSTAVWTLRALRRQHGDSVIVCTTVSFDNAPEMTCCRRIWIPQAEAVLECALSAPVISADKVNSRYLPMPFDVTAVVTNTGGKQTDSVYATIVVPPDLALVAPGETKKVIPTILNPGQQGGVSWTLTHPISATKRVYKVGVWTWTAAGDSTYCETTVTIPSIDAPALSPQCSAPDTLRFDPATDSYTPNPFTVTVQCPNRGGSSAYNATAVIALPPNMMFANGGETAIKTFSPSTIDVYTGGAMPQLSWSVRFIGRPSKNTPFVFRCVVASTDKSGNPLDTVSCQVTVIVAKAGMPLLSPTCAIPDSLRFDATKDGYIPNPFTVAVDCPNYGDLAAANATATLILPNGVVFDDPKDVATKTFSPATIPVYQGGVAPRLSWQLRYTQRLTFDNNLDFKIVVRCTTPGGAPVDSAFCQKTVRVGKAPATLSPRITPAGPVTLCQGDTVVLEAADGYASYLWSTGDTTRSIEVVASGSYTVTVRDQAGQQGTSPAVVVTVLPAPKPRLNPGGIREFCEGDVVSIDGGPGYASYRWNTGDTTRMLRVTTSGAWWVTVRSAEGCTGVSDTVTTVMNPIPPVPTIGRNGDVLSTIAGYVYQWNLNGAPVPGATAQTLIVTQTGDYTVTVTSNKGCSRTSQPYSVTTLPVENTPQAEAWSLDLHPDPAGDAIFVTVGHLAASSCTVQLLDHIGRVLEWKDVVRSGATFPVSFDLASRPSGVYFISVMSEGRSIVKRFVKMR
jgi:hypothetical protein